MQVTANTGAQNAPDGLQGQNGVPLRAGRQGDLIVSELHGRYFETNRNKNLNVVANQAPTVTTVGLATTYTGLCLTNPVNSGVNLMINKVGYAFPVAPAAALVIGIMTGYNATTAVTQTTPISPSSQFVGQPTPLGLGASSVTLPTAPVVDTILGTVSAAIQTGPTLIDLEDSIIIPPGGYAAFYTSAASGAAGFMGSMQYEVAPI